MASDSNKNEEQLNTSEENASIEERIFAKIKENDAAGLSLLLCESKIGPDVVDENGMTPLQHASYKGSKEMVQILLDHGADVNSGKHEHNYTALHFAALSGNEEVCMMLLNHGAKSHAVNSVNRTATQMAAFVGNHNCVAAINNFVPKSDVDYYTVARGLDKVPKLNPLLATPFHKFVMQVNIHPIKILMNLQHVPILVENSEEIRKVLELMSEREIKRVPDTNEVLSFKFHWLSLIMAEVAAAIKEGTSEKKPIEICMKKLIKPAAIYEFVRKSVKTFPYGDCTLFRQLVSSLSSLASEKAPPSSAIQAVKVAINGQRGFAADSQCSTCGEEKAPRRCSRCKDEIYCGQECQKLHWPIHKKTCKPGNKTDTEVDPNEIQETVTKALSQSLSVN